MEILPTPAVLPHICDYTYTCKVSRRCSWWGVAHNKCSNRFRHLCDDIRKMMPHHKTVKLAALTFRGAFSLLVFDPGTSLANLARRPSLRKDQTSMRLTWPCIDLHPACRTHLDPGATAQICELKNCNNVVFFEARKREDL